MENLKGCLIGDLEGGLEGKPIIKKRKDKKKSLTNPG
jgi:hypothetical protein